MLNISSEGRLSSEEFQFTVKNVSKLEPAKMNKELSRKYMVKIL